MFTVFFSIFFICIVFVIGFVTLYQAGHLINKHTMLTGSIFFGILGIVAMFMGFVTFFNELPPNDLDTCKQKETYYREEGKLPLHYLDDYIFECININ